MAFTSKYAVLLFFLGLAAGPVVSAQPKIKIIFVRYNLLKEGEELSVVKNDPVVAGQINQLVLTMFNTGGTDYRGVTIKPISRDRYLNVRLADRTRAEIILDEFREGALKTLREYPIIVTVAPTCPDEYMGNLYLELSCPEHKLTIRQFVVEVSNPGILAASADKFNELYGGLGVKPPPSLKELQSERPEITITSQQGKSGTKGRTTESISATIQKYQMEIYYCYQQQLRKFQNLRGNVIMKFTIHPAGEVTNIKVIRSTLNNEEVEACLIRRMKTWKFSTIPRSFGALDITYPFVFDTTPTVPSSRGRR